MEETIYCAASDDIQSICKTLRKKQNCKLIIEPGTYEISSEIAGKTMNDVLNGVLGENPEKIMFNPDFKYSKGLDFCEAENVTVEAYGVTLMIDGFMEPVSISNCKNFKLKGLTIDHKRKPYSKALVKEVQFTDKAKGNGFATVEFGKEYPVKKGIPMPRVCLFSTYAGRFNLYGEANFDTEHSEEIETQIWKFPFTNVHEDITGNEFYVWHTFHSRPAIMIENCKDICLEDVTINSQPGMGVVAHRNENLLFKRLRVIPSAGEHMSTNTDATHITSCRGKVEYDCCVFEGQGDDSVNLHTYYHKIEKTESKKCLIRLTAPTGTHSQTADYPENGDLLELTEADTLAVTEIYKVLECENIDYLTSELVLDKDLPENCNDYIFADKDCQPDFYFHDCLCHSHLARGVLSKTKRAVIENNQFIEVVGTAIDVTAEAYWSEGTCATENIEILRNHISFCGRTNSIRQNDCAGITVTLCAVKPEKAVHKNVVISDNIIDCPHSPRGIYVSNTENLSLERNSVRCKDKDIIIEEFGEPDL